MSDYDAADDSRRSYDLGIRAGREKRVRSHIYDPINETEQRWWDEGPVSNNQLETVRHG